MFTQCPSCQMSFRVGAQQLSAASGQVRCGRCQQVFNALESLSDETPERDATPPELGRKQPEDILVKGPLDSEDKTITVEAMSPAGIGEFDFENSAHHSGNSTLKSGLWLIMNLALITVLFGQTTYTYRDHLSQDMRFRPLLEKGCQLVDCTLPAWQDVSKIELIQRDIYADPDKPGTLTVSVTLVNTADTAQPVPTLEITLARLDGNLIGLRRFNAAEIQNDNLSLLTPNSPAQFSFDLIDPGEEASSFRFELI